MKPNIHQKDPLPSVRVFLMVGFPGSGKSTLAKKMAKHFACVYLSSDAYREKLLKSVRYDPKGDALTDKDREIAHAQLYKDASQLLRKGKRLVLDATHLEIERRTQAVKILSVALKKNEMCFVLVNTPRKIIDQRMSLFDTIACERNGETQYQAWKRVVGYFDEKEKKSIVRWPTKKEGVLILNGGELEKRMAAED